MGWTTNKIRVLVMVLLGLFFSNNSIAQTYSEEDVKAAFICNFAKFVWWPEERFQDENSPLIIGIYGKDPFGPVLNRISKTAKIANRHIQVKRLETHQDGVGCHIVYIGDLGHESHMIEALAYFRGNHILSIGEDPNFCRYGGIINFSKEKAKYGFEINAKKAEKEGLQISAKLLKLATIVE